MNPENVSVATIFCDFLQEKVKQVEVQLSAFPLVNHDSRPNYGSELSGFVNKLRPQNRQTDRPWKAMHSWSQAGQ